MNLQGDNNAFKVITTLHINKYARHIMRKTKKKFVRGGEERYRMNNMNKMKKV